MDKWHIFGDVGQFSFQFRFRADPDSGEDSPNGSSASWGDFRIIVKSVNLCESVGVVDSAEGSQKIVVDSVTWYLLPLFRWIAKNWDPLFHEYKFPDTIDTGKNPNTAYNVYDRYESVLCDVESPKGLKQFGKWQKWWKRHALREASDGGIFPDIFIRRFGNDVELSWGDRKWPGMPEEYHLAKPGACILPISEVATALYGVLSKARDILQGCCPDSEDVKEFANFVSMIPRTPLEKRSMWFAETAWAEKYIKKFKKVLDAFQNNIVGELFIEEFSPVKVMFGSVSPKINKKDIETILRWLEKVIGCCPGDIDSKYSSASQIDFLVRPADDGYVLADVFLEEFGRRFEDFVDVKEIYSQLGIGFDNIELDDINIRAISFVVAGFLPIVAVNLNCRFNHGEEGYRFTLAHELCHILHDRRHGQSLAIVSGPWAPIELEKRANAFAAMLLMPRKLIEKKIESDDLFLDNITDITKLAVSFKTSRKSAFEHLTNLGFISYVQHELMKTELRQQM